MRKNKIKVCIATVTLAAMLSGCFGSFGATRMLYGWNESIGGDGFGGRFLRTIVMWGLSIIPVYPLFLFGDFWILNTIEFFTGTRLVGANVDKIGDTEVLVHAADGQIYRIAAVTSETFVVEQDGVQIGEGTINESGEMHLLNPDTGATTFMQIGAH